MKKPDIKSGEGNQNKRQSNIELLRIVLMLFIIVHHLLYHVLELYNPVFLLTGAKSKVFLGLGLESLSIMSVNTFIFISGYYGINMRLKGFLSLWTQAVFYSIAIGFIFYLLRNIPFNIVYSSFPFSINIWWYFSCYFLLYLVSPIVNKGIDSMAANQLLLITICMFYINSILGLIFNLSFVANGYSFFSFLSIYLLSRYIKKTDFVLSLKQSLTGYFVCVLILFSISITCLFLNKLEILKMVFNYNNPFVVLLSLFMFFSFKNLNLKSGLINYASTLVFGIYLIHDHYLIRNELRAFLKEWIINADALFFPVLILACTISIFILSALIESLRTKLFHPVLEKIVSLKWVREIDARFFPNQP